MYVCMYERRVRLLILGCMYLLLVLNLNGTWEEEGS